MPSARVSLRGAQRCRERCLVDLKEPMADPGAPLYPWHSGTNPLAEHTNESINVSKYMWGEQRPDFLAGIQRPSHIWPKFPFHMAYAQSPATTLLIQDTSQRPPLLGHLPSLPWKGIHFPTDLTCSLLLLFTHCFLLMSLHRSLSPSAWALSYLSLYPQYLGPIRCSVSCEIVHLKGSSRIVSCS